MNDLVSLLASFYRVLCVTKSNCVSISVSLKRRVFIPVGAFLIPYLVMVSLVGVPLFFLESSVGQFTSSGLLTLYNVAPMFRGEWGCAGGEARGVVRRSTMK